MVLGIEPQTHRIRRSTGVIRQGEHRIVFINDFDDFRMVDGFLIPHHLVNTSMGLKVADSRLVKVEINPDLEDKDFRPAAGGGL